jgi:hypothetical protein
MSGSAMAVYQFHFNTTTSMRCVILKLLDNHELEMTDIVEDQLISDEAILYIIDRNIGYSRYVGIE